MGEIQKASQADMNADEARQRIDRVKNNVAIADTALNSARADLVELHDRKGWKALGYKSWEQFGSTEFPDQSRRTLYRELKAGRFELEMDKADVIEDIPTDLPYLKPLNRLPVADRKAAWDQVQALAKGKTISLQMVESVVQKRINESYLASFDIREKLSDPCRKIFDAEATGHRDLEAATKQFFGVALYQLKRVIGSNKLGPYSKGVYALSKEPGPDEWCVCPDCQGTGQFQLIGNCPTCSGYGFHTRKYFIEETHPEPAGV